MYQNPNINEALQYFSVTNHPHSFELLSGIGGVMLSAPHAVLQTRNGRPKQAERYTGMLARLLNQQEGTPCIYKTLHLADDANHDEQSDYRDRLCDYIRENCIRCLLDLHQLSPTRPMDLCLGTGKGQNLHGQNEVVKILQAAFLAHAFSRQTVDDPFSASGIHTVSSTVARECGIPAVQIELNSRLLMEDQPEERFSDIMDALGNAIQALNQIL
ncbi:MAG: hypothetical protein PHI98_09595 [Eubacteriales bacterium]|nr:hypothetical protein [Eubacteriales bacterium]